MLQRNTVWLLGSLLVIWWLTAVNFDYIREPGPGNRYGNATRVFPSAEAYPQRIVSLSPGHTEMLFALGAGDRVVGVTSYSDYPEEAKTKPSVGGYHAPDVETIVALRPDVVFAMGDIQEPYTEILRRAGIRVITLEPATLEEVLAAIDRMSEAIGERERGRELNRRLSGQLEDVQNRVSSVPSRRVFLEVWDAPLLTVGNRSFIHDVVRLAGGVNVAGGRQTDYTPCDVETLYAYDPDVYVVLNHDGSDAEALINRPDLAGLAAVKNRQVYSIPDVLSRAGPRCFDGLDRLARILHPAAMEQQETQNANNVQVIDIHR